MSHANSGSSTSPAQAWMRDCLNERSRSPCCTSRYADTRWSGHAKQFRQEWSILPSGFATKATDVNASMLFKWEAG